MLDPQLSESPDYVSTKQQVEEAAVEVADMFELGAAWLKVGTLDGIGRRTAQDVFRRSFKKRRPAAPEMDQVTFCVVDLEWLALQRSELHMETNLPVYEREKYELLNMIGPLYHKQ